MSTMTETTAETELLLIEGLEIEPLPDVLITSQEVDTFTDPHFCSCEWCSSGPDEPPPPPPKECTWFSFFLD
jgi:hypothetical protein